MTAAVYNLTVEPEHVYYANGILVSNCNSVAGVLALLGAKRDYATVDVPVQEQPSAWTRIGEVATMDEDFDGDNGHNGNGRHRSAFRGRLG